MKTAIGKICRPSLLKGTALAGLAWVSRPLLGAAMAQEQAAGIVAASVNRAPTEPNDPDWAMASPLSVVLSPQNIVLPRLQEAFPEDPAAGGTSFMMGQQGRA